MRTILLTALLLGLTVAASASAEPAPQTSPASSSPGPQASPTARLTAGASTMDELLAKFVDALGRSDRKALDALRVTKPEYRDLIVPGNVPPGEPPARALSQDANDYYWGVMEEKSAYHRENILKSFGGKKLTIQKFEFEKGTKEYAGHRAYKRLVLTVVDEQGHVEEIHTGSVVERDGQLKFMSFIRD